ncbi:MAG: helix-turn-helix transcriptional regulator [Gemmatimonadales bacterium]
MAPDHSATRPNSSERPVASRVATSAIDSLHGNQAGVVVNWLASELPDPAEQREYAQWRAIDVVADRLRRVMESKGITRAQLAERVGKSKGHISRVLGGERNMTLRTLADVLWACDTVVGGLEIAPLGTIVCTPDTADAWLAQEWGREGNNVEPVKSIVDHRPEAGLAKAILHPQWSFRSPGTPEPEQRETAVTGELALAA